VKRLFDVTLASVSLVLLSPLLAAVALGIRLASPGPVLYRARRVGRGGDEFVMHKFRTMHVRSGQGSVITAANDGRLFPLGALLRATKIDELPQLYDVLRGKMSIVGPRPEDPKIVAGHYTPEQWETLAVLPGLASPGSIYHYTHGDRYLHDDDPEGSYCEGLLPVKLALDLEYVRRASFLYDLQVIRRTAWVIACVSLGKRDFPDPPELARAPRSAAPGSFDVPPA
jgi:lipopolysaccharide/colanic/teichoic acid biosynthesis glycosyltransferase